jgi:predicted transcriptional regulator
MASTRKNTFEVQIFTRITKDMDTLLDKIAEEQERSKSFILRKALEQYLQVKVIN